jgi:hypothetical protein
VPQGRAGNSGGAIAPLRRRDGLVALAADGPTEVGLNTGEYDSWTGHAIEVNCGSTQIWGFQVYAVCARLG